MPTWKPRSSSLAGYAYCDARAMYDRALFDGKMQAEPCGERDTKYADLGTLIHAETQTLAGCVFDGPAPLSDMAGEGLKQMRTCAARLFGDDLDRLDRAVDAAARAAVAALPAAPDGKPWRAEVRATSRLLSGHIDLLSQDGTVLIDLKTTSRKPDHNRVKGEHFMQMLAYKFLVPTIQTAHILYVDALGAKWTILSLPMQMGPTSEAQACLPRMEAWLRRLRSRGLYATAMPRPGGHCSGCFCPHTAICKDLMIPAAGPVVDHTPPTIHPTVTEIFP